MKLLLVLTILISVPLLAAELAEASIPEFINRLEIRLASDGTLSEICFSVEQLRQLEDYAQEINDKALAQRLQNIAIALQENKAFQEQGNLFQHTNRLTKLVMLLHIKQHLEQLNEAPKTVKSTKPTKRVSRRHTTTPVFDIFDEAGDLGASKVYSATLEANKALAEKLKKELAIVCSIIESLETELNKVHSKQIMIDKMLVDYPSLRTAVKDKYDRLLTKERGYLEKLSLERIHYADLERQVSEIQITSDQTKSALLDRIDLTTTERQQIESAITALERNSEQLEAEIREFENQINERRNIITSNNEQKKAFEARLLFLLSKQDAHRGYKKQLAEDNLAIAVEQGTLLRKPEDYASTASSSNN